MNKQLIQNLIDRANSKRKSGEPLIVLDNTPWYIKWWRGLKLDWYRITGQCFWCKDVSSIESPAIMCSLKKHFPKLARSLNET